jgi:hypothetical protein
VNRRDVLQSASVIAGFALLPAISAESAEETQATAAVTRAFISGEEAGFQELGENDFTNVNCAPDTWTWKDDVLHCTGRPTGVLRTNQAYTNFEMVCQWCHRRSAGNSGIFVWVPKARLDAMQKAGRPGLPYGIEVQVLDLGYTESYEKRYKKSPNWFSCHGDVFSVGQAKMEPFPPIAPVLKGKSFTYHRSFPSKQLSRGINEWNHYYIRAINGEVRLWVNGEEVSGGTNCTPNSGYICLESEGAPIEFRNLRIRELP